MWVWSTCPWWNREVQITEFVKQWIPAQLHSEAHASKDGQIRSHIRPDIRRPYRAGAGYGRIWKFGRISAGTGAGYDIRCNPRNNRISSTIGDELLRHWIPTYFAYCNIARIHEICYMCQLLANLKLCMACFHLLVNFYQIFANLSTNVSYKLHNIYI